MTDIIYKMFDLSGEVAIITGGMGQLGSEYAKTLSSAGAKVAIFDVSDKVSPKVQALMDGGNKVSSHRVEITQKSEVSRAFDEAEARHGAATILINNAGLDSSPNAPAEENGPFEGYPESSWDAVVDSHLKGAFLMSQEFIKRFRKAGKKQGSIVNIGSTYGVVSPDQSLYDFRRRSGEEFFKPIAYSVAKSGMLNFTRWLAEYCGYLKLGIRVNTLVPGGVFAGQNEEFLGEYNRRTILGRMADVDEYNGAILFLVSRASSYMTGSTLIIDGGWTAR